MMINWSPNFCLIQGNDESQLPELRAACRNFSCNENTHYVALTYPREKSLQATIVNEIVCALLYCEAQQIPLYLVREPSDIEISTHHEQGFCLYLQTSGTTGKPKWCKISAERLLANIKPFDSLGGDSWLLCYHPFSFAGIQVLLQAMIAGNTLLAYAQYSVAEQATLASEKGITALSCTPSYFRNLNMAWRNAPPPLKRITLGGEIATQSVLDDASSTFPNAKIRHIYASTEAGVVFTVSDKKSGFPLQYLSNEVSDTPPTKGWQLSVSNNELVLQKGEEQIFTGDMVKFDQDRCHFVGRSDNIVNVGGAKVDTLALENQILNLQAVDDARVFAKANPITGNIIGLEVKSANQALAKQQLSEWQQNLPAYMQPRLVTWVPEITLSSAGKKIRTSA